MNIWNKKLTKILSSVLIGSILCGTIGVIAYDAGTNNSSKNNVSTAAKTSSAAVKDTRVNKEETVYALANADGSVKKIIVSDWIKNSLNENSISDYSGLSNVTNVKGDETYTMDKDNMRVWDAEGNDIYYQGTIEKELPVNISISYKLDGKSISADELAGKSGKVTIHFAYTNNQKQNVTIDGKKETIYVPFTMLTGMILDNDNFSNVQVTNGKVINDGDRCVVIGFALPGMQENLGISKDDFEIPDYVEITADATNFELTTTLTFAAKDVFSNLNTDKIKNIDSLTGSMKQLCDAESKLIDGSSALYDGLSHLLGKSGELITGIDKLAAGAKQLADGTNNLKSGTNELKAKLSTLSEGLKALTSSNDSLNAGAKKVFESLLKTANSQLSAAGLTVPALTIDNYVFVLNGVIATLEKSSKDVSQNAAAVKQAKAGIASITALLAQLDSYNEFYKGLLMYTSGVGQAYEGSNLLVSGAGQLSNGASKLSDGADALYGNFSSLRNGGAALVDGIDQLTKGAMQLSNGMKEFNEKGIQKLADALDGNLNGVLTRLRATVDVAKEYQNFTGISDDMSGSVKFIYKTDAID